MKPSVLLLFLMLLLLSSSSPEDFHNPSEYFPILMETQDLERSIMFLDTREIRLPGKIYYKDGMIYLIEKYQGVHVIDNHDPSNPVNIGFINIPGCIDIAVRNNSLLADNATDLVSVYIRNLDKLEVTERIKNVFPESTPPDLDYIPYMFTPSNRPENTVIIGWKKMYR